MTTLKIRTTDNRVIASAAFSRMDRFDWVQEIVAQNFDCSADDIGTTDDNEITVRGEIVAYLG